MIFITLLFFIYNHLLYSFNSYLSNLIQLVVIMFLFLNMESFLKSLIMVFHNFIYLLHFHEKSLLAKKGFIFDWFNFLDCHKRILKHFFNLLILLIFLYLTTILIVFFISLKNIISCLKLNSNFLTIDFLILVLLIFSKVICNVYYLAISKDLTLNFLIIFIFDFSIFHYMISIFFMNLFIFVNLVNNQFAIIFYFFCFWKALLLYYLHYWFNLR